MATRMNPLAGRYFNDPSFAAGLSNLAGAFAPPSPDEYLAAEKLRGVRTQNSALDQLLGSANGNVDILGGVASGGWTPNQGFENFRGQLANQRYNIDTDAATSLSTNAADNERALRLGAFGAMTDPSGRQAISDEEIMGALGVEGMGGFGQAGPVAPTESQVLGANLQEQIGGIPGLAEALAADDVAASNVVTADGVRMAPTGLAAVQGQEPFINRGAESAPKPIILVDPNTGQQQAGFAVNGQYVLGDGQTPAPPSLVPQNLPQAQGSAEELGLGTTNRNRIDAQGLAAVSALDTIGQLETLISSNPASQGLVGSLRGTAQNVMETGNELGRFFGGTMAEVNQAVSSGLIDQGVAGEMFDPSIPAIDMLMNVLAWQYAKSFAGDRVSNEQLRIAREAIGSSGVFNNQSNSLTRLGQLRDMFGRDLNRLAPVLSPEVNTMAAPYMGGTTPAPSAPMPSAGGAGGRIRYDAEGNRIQ
jgi:hypothetical protein